MSVAMRLTSAEALAQRAELLARKAEAAAQAQRAAEEEAAQAEAEARAREAQAETVLAAELTPALLLLWLGRHAGLSPGQLRAVGANELDGPLLLGLGAAGRASLLARVLPDLLPGLMARLCLRLDGRLAPARSPADEEVLVRYPAAVEDDGGRRIHCRRVLDAWTAELQRLDDAATQLS
jgi:hypothetical protein